MTGIAARRLNAAEQPYSRDQKHRADGRADDRADKPQAYEDPEREKDPPSNECAHDANEEIADQAEATAAHDLAREPTSYQADEQKDDKAAAVHPVPPKPLMPLGLLRSRLGEPTCARSVSARRLVPLAGLEPAHPCGQQILSLPTPIFADFR
ncbi:MAG: hypothetical protein ACREHV_07640 [Rhizomicrobium sp.]